jgi:hypothetical protein
MRCTHRCSSLLLTGFGLLFTACTDPTGRTLSPELSLEKSAAIADPTVTSAVPSEAEQGTTLDVQINGSGFDRGSLAHWERNGAVDPRVRVNGTRFVKSTQLIANLTIALDAEVSPYDIVVVTAAGKKGIGTEKFAVRLTNALPIWTIDETQSLNFAGDGRGDYVSGECGLVGQIFYGNYDPATGLGGDVTLGDIGAGSTGCLPRSIRATLNGVAVNVGFMNVRYVVGIKVGESRTDNFGVGLNGGPTCERLGWWAVADGGAGGQMTVTRTASDTWLATTHGNARCNYIKGRIRIWGTTFDNIQASFVIKQQPN